MGDYDGGVQVDDDQPAVTAGGVLPGQGPRSFPCCRAGGPDRLQCPLLVCGQGRAQPGDHRVRGHRPGELGLVTQRGDVGQAIPAQGERGGQVRDDLARAMDRPRRPPPGQALRQAPGQARDPHRLPQQDGPGLGTRPLPSADTVTRAARTLFFT